METQKDQLLLINEEWYQIAFSRRKEPYQLVEVWHKTLPFGIKIFEIPYTMSENAIKTCITVYQNGYTYGYEKGKFDIRDQLKRILNIKDRS